MKRKLFVLIFLSVGFAFIFQGCDKTDNDDTIDTDMYNFAKSSEGNTWFQNSDEILNTTNISGHRLKRMRVHYNAEASKMLDANGRVKPNIKFGTGSVIVKEFFDTLGVFHEYAIMYKNPDNVNADTTGWIWGEYSQDGTVIFSAKNRAGSRTCLPCHAITDNIDYTLMNKSIPVGVAK